MAEPDYRTQSWSPLTTSPGGPESSLTAPLLTATAPFQQQFPPSYEPPHLPRNDPSMSNFQDLANTAYTNPMQGRSPYPSGGNSYSYLQSTAAMYPYHPTHPRPPAATWNGPEQFHMDSRGLYAAGNTMQIPQFSPSSTLRLPHRREGPVRASQGQATSVRPRYDPRMSPASVTRGSNAEGMHAPQEQLPNMPPGVRQYNQGQPHRDFNPSQDPMVQRTEQHPWVYLESQIHRSDRSMSPRTSNRRNFDRYSSDLPQTSTSSDVEEAAARAPPLSRARQRPRETRPRFPGHAAQFDPNVTTPGQIQELKDKLPRRLPSQLSEDASKACEICQRDYSTTRVEPIEGEEIAIELPCGHFFGEFCIFQWFDTCRTHKNKVTCPMCRKQLIEPSRYHQAMVHAFSRGGQVFQDLLASELRSDIAQA